MRRWFCEILRPFGLIISELWPGLGFQPPWHSSLRFQRNVIFSFPTDSFWHLPSGLDLSFVNFGLLLWDFLKTKIIEAAEDKIWTKEATTKKWRLWFDEKCLKKSFDDSIFDFYFKLRLLCHRGWKSEDGSSLWNGEAKWPQNFTNHLLIETKKRC